MTAPSEATLKAKDKSSKYRTDSGFTLIELLVTGSMVAILAAIAMTNFANYKRRGFNTVAKADLKTAIIAQEAYFSDNQAYFACADAVACETGLNGFVASKNSDGSPTISTFNFVLDGENYTGTAKHPKGNITFIFENQVGSMVENLGL